MGELPRKELFRPDEVAVYLGVNRETVYRWIREKKIEGVKVGGKLIRIARYEVLKMKKSVS